MTPPAPEHTLRVHTLRAACAHRRRPCAACSCLGTRQLDRCKQKRSVQPDSLIDGSKREVFEVFKQKRSV